MQKQLLASICILIMFSILKVFAMHMLSNQQRVKILQSA